jgi:hypothetical protein
MLTRKANRKVNGRKKAAKRSSLTGKRARVAAKAAKKHYASKGSRPAAWKAGGREWSKILGHFGLSSDDSSKR